MSKVFEITLLDPPEFGFTILITSRFELDMHFAQIIQRCEGVEHITIHKYSLKVKPGSLFTNQEVIKNLMIISDKYIQGQFKVKPKIDDFIPPQNAQDVQFSSGGIDIEEDIKNSLKEEYADLDESTLKIKLQKYINNEDYERAALVRDEINSRKESKEKK